MMGDRIDELTKQFEILNKRLNEGGLESEEYDKTLNRLLKVETAIEAAEESEQRLEERRTRLSLDADKEIAEAEKTKKFYIFRIVEIVGSIAGSLGEAFINTRPYHWIRHFENEDEQILSGKSPNYLPKSIFRSPFKKG